jgi:RNA-directed DNA polymerase
MPSKKALHRVKHHVRECLKRTKVQPLPEVVATVNHNLRGWATYFRYGSVLRTRQNLAAFVYQRVRGFLRRRPQLQNRGARRFSRRYVFQELGVLSLESLGGSA